jgi:GH35 family endo-1,4-beta-xylanase
MTAAMLALVIVQQPLFTAPISGWSANALEIKNTSSPKGRAILLSNLAAGPNPWSNAAHKQTEAPVEAGDVVSFSAWVRSPDKAKLGVMLEMAVEPHTKYISAVVSPGLNWREVRFAGQVPRSFPAGGMQVALFRGYNAGTVELADIRLVNLGKVDLQKVSQTIDYYGSAENPGTWRKAALERIEKFRKGDLTIRVVDGHGRAVPNTRVSVEQTRHAFKFGTAAPAARLVGTSLDDVRYQATVKRLFNTVTFENDLKWNTLESQDYANVDRAIDWLHSNGIQVRAHNLVWGSRRNLPRGLWEKNDAEVWSIVQKRVKDAATRFRGKVYLWDVVNEAVSETELWDRIGWDKFPEVFKLARAADPNVQLAYNDYNITEENEAGPAHKLKAKERIESILKAGAPLDVIGIQAHVGVPITPMKRVREILDEMSVYGKPLEITEYDLGVQDDAVNGEHMRDFLTACFSHPKVQAFIMWGFWEGSHWRAAQGGAMIRRDWSWRPAAKVWEDLTRRQWWTRTSGSTGSDGRLKVRGFKGDYQIKIGSQVVTAKITGGNDVLTIRT